MIFLNVSLTITVTILFKLFIYKILQRILCKTKYFVHCNFFKKCTSRCLKECLILNLLHNSDWTCEQQKMPSAEGSFKVWIYLGFIVGLTRSSRPRFDTSTDMRKVLIPPDADVDSVIFRLRATDEEPDFPLIFNVSGKILYIYHSYIR